MPYHSPDGWVTVANHSTKGIVSPFTIIVCSVAVMKSGFKLILNVIQAVAFSEKDKYQKHSMKNKCNKCNTHRFNYQYLK